MESWKQVWRNGFSRVLPLVGLEALRRALTEDDKRLTQGSTTTPPPLMCVQDWPCEAADAIAFCGWQGDGLATVGEVTEFFARACFEADRRLGEAAACRWFLNWWDEGPRDEKRRELLAEVERTVDLRLTGGMCDVCDQPGTEDNPVARVTCSAGETYAHAAGCPGEQS